MKRETRCNFRDHRSEQTEQIPQRFLRTWRRTLGSIMVWLVVDIGRLARQQDRGWLQTLVRDP